MTNWLGALLISIISLPPAWAAKAIDLAPTVEQAQARVHEHLMRLSSAPLSGTFTKGQVEYVPVRAISPGQNRYSHQRFLIQLKKSRNKPLVHDDGRALFGLDDPGFGVLYRGRVYLYEGHHQMLVSLYRGATTAPIRILGDWTSRFPNESGFRRALRRLGLSHHTDVYGETIDPIGWDQLEDDENVEFIRTVSLKVKAHLKDGKVVITKAKGTAYPVIIKLNDGIPFQELIAAEVLANAGFQWDGHRPPSLEDLTYHLDALHRAHFVDQPRRPLILPDRLEPASSLPLASMIADALRAQTCMLALAPKTDIVAP